MDKKKLEAELYWHQNALRLTPLDLEVIWVQDRVEKLGEPTWWLKLTLCVITSSEIKTLRFRLDDLLSATESEFEFANRTVRRLKELHDYIGREVPKPKPYTPPLPMKNYNNLISLAQDNIMTTVEVTVPNGSRLIYKLNKSLTAEENSHVVVYYNSSLVIGVVKTVHESSQVEVHPTKTYDWVISVIDNTHVELYNKQRADEDSMTERLKANEKKLETEKAKKEILLNLSLEDKAILGLEAPKD